MLGKNPSRCSLLGGVALTFLAIGSFNIYAATIPTGDGGILQLVNSQGNLVGVTTAPPCINWGGGNVCAGATHNVSVSGSSVDFTAPSTGLIKDLTGTAAVGFEAIPGGTAVGGATVNFDLVKFFTNGPSNVGNCTSNAPLNTCTPANSPFTFAEDITGQQVTISFAVGLNAYTGSNMTGVTPYLGVFTTHQSGTVIGSGACAGAAANITSILDCEFLGGTIMATWAATESPLNPTKFNGCSYTQGGWGAAPHGNNPGAILQNAFPKVYPNGVSIGGFGAGQFHLTFTSSSAVMSFLPQGGPPAALNASATNPTSSSAGVFAGQVLALELNVDIDGYGNVIVSGSGTSFDGKTVAVVLAAANQALAGGALPAGFTSISQLNDLVDFLNQLNDHC